MVGDQGGPYHCFVKLWLRSWDLGSACSGDCEDEARVRPPEGPGRKEGHHHHLTSLMWPSPHSHPPCICSEYSFCSKVWNFHPKSSPFLRAVPKTQPEEKKDKKPGIAWACSLTKESLFLRGLLSLFLCAAGSDSGLCPWVSVLGLPFPIRLSPSVGGGLGRG